MTVGIGQYNGLPNLIGVAKDYENVIYVFNNKYNYSVCYKKNENHGNENVYLHNEKVDINKQHLSKKLKTEWTVDEIINFLEDARDTLVKNYHDSLIIIISSHGTADGIIYDSEDEQVSLLSLVEIFKSDKCPHLVNKPKIAFVDACRSYICYTKCKNKQH